MESFLKRNQLELSPCPVSLKFPPHEDEEDGILSGFLRPVFNWDPSEETHQYRAHRPPLWQRAWVVQERMLAPRLLMFSDVQMSCYVAVSGHLSALLRADR
jgi:hypothetical protein